MIMTVRLKDSFEGFCGYVTQEAIPVFDVIYSEHGLRFLIWDKSHDEFRLIQSTFFRPVDM